jgi:hypothetical protein
MSARQTPLTCTIEPDELLGLSALAELDRAATGGGTGTSAVRMAKALMRTALADKLEQAGLPWAPSAEAASQRAAQAAAPASTMRRIAGNGKARKAAAWVAAAALAVTLWGGYTRGWQWTGFRGQQPAVGLAHPPAAPGRPRRLRPAVAVDRLRRKYCMGLAPGAPAAGVPDSPASALAHMGLG